ncbi:MAG: TonB family protein [Halioglobus sp.]|jgi:TonB family protein
MGASIYARPVAPRVIVRPMLATLALHALVIGAMTVNWESQETSVVKVKPAPKVINARLVDVSELKPKKKVSKPAPKTVAKPKPVVKPKPKPKPVVKIKPAVKPKPKPVVKPEPEPRMTPAELEALAQRELAQAMAVEEQQLEEEATATAGELAASFSSLIQRTVAGYWSRPPSARNGMEVLLALQLIPTGEVVSVTVIEGSGSAAFDRSAVNAVEKAGRFPELQNLPAREFEKSFRRFQMLFRPEDLRY